MHLPSMLAASARRLRSAPIDCAIGLLLLALSALAILPGIAFFAACTVVAAIGARRSPAARQVPIRNR